MKTKPETCWIDVAFLLRRHKMTIRDLSAKTGITLKSIRVIRESKKVSYSTYCDLTQAITGVNVFNYDRYAALSA